MTTTIVIEPGWLADLDPSGVYVVTMGTTGGEVQQTAHVVEVA